MSMQKISRIYVGGYGASMAWYDGVTLDLTDPDTGEPTDTILNLENGGGKTTLLSFVFSCFDTGVDRFLKHIQNPNHRFSQYFSPDGQPGIILMEWVMPPRVAGGKPYRLVIGQAVAIKAETEQPDRVFFSFESNPGLTFESVPAPKLNFAPVNTMNDFGRWLANAHKSAQDFFHTRVQHDWQAHLRDERLIDLEMLQLQVNFSAQEGGIDTGFLTFHSEPEFIRRFFSLTLDQGMAASVRQVVVDVCDKLRRKPHLQKCLTELTRLRGSLTSFDIAAKGYAEARSEQDSVLLRGKRLTAGLEAMVRELRDEEYLENEKQETQAQLAKDKQALVNRLTADVTTLTLLQHTRDLEAARAGKDVAQSQVDEASATQRHVRAAKAQTEIDGLETRLADLVASSEAERNQLSPWLDKVEVQGALLIQALVFAEEELRAQAQAAQAEESDSVARIDELKKARALLDTVTNRLTAEAAKLSAEESAYSTALAQLVSEGVLESGEGTAQAMHRYATRAEVERAKADEWRSQADVLRTRELEAGRLAGEVDKDLVTKEGSIGKLDEFLADGEAERERLSQLPILRAAAEADVADPESPALLPALERVRLAAESAAAQCTVQLSILNASQAAIVETGVAGATRDVNEVVTRLREMGVKSAKPFNTYLSRAVPDATTARQLVVSNPSRFLGVSVASSEFIRARDVVRLDTALGAPVMVSVAALEPDAESDDRFVLPAADDAAFNLEAAQALLAQLGAKLANEEANLAAHKQRVNDALTAKAELQAYVRKYGGGALARARTEIKELRHAAMTAAEQARILRTQATECHQLAELARSNESTCFSAAVAAEKDGMAVRRFSENHDAGRPARLARLEAIPAEREAQEAQRKELDTAKQQVEAARDAAYKCKLEREAELSALSRERLAVTYCRAGYPANEELRARSQDLALLRQLYDDAKDAYTTQADSRLGLLGEREKSVRDALGASRQAFAKEFGTVPAEAYEPYLASTDFVALFNECEVRLATANAELKHEEEAEIRARTTRELFVRANPRIAPATAEMEALDEAAVADTLACTQEAKRDADAAMQVATHVANQYKEAARQAGDKANSAEQAAGALRASLRLPDWLDVETETPDSAFALQTTNLITEFQARSKESEGAHDRAMKTFQQLKADAASSTLLEVEPDIALQLQRNEFEAACADSARLLEGLDDRIETTQSSLAGMSKDFEACVGELHNLTNSAITLLNSAATNKRVPAGAPYVGGKAILKMRARFSELGHDVRRQQLSNYLDDLIESKTVPARGAELVGDALLHLHGKPLGLQMLKMVPDEALQYVAVDKIQNSGGEGVVMAMFLYMLINQLRSETQAKLKKAGGGPLILDNPFAKATTATLWQAQRLLAQAMDVQLIFATALPDYNTVGEFGRFNRLRKAGRNSKTGRWHIEVVDFKLNAQQEDAAA